AGALGQYHRYTQNQSVLDQLVPWGFAGKILAAAAVLGCVFFLWKVRRHPGDAVEFGAAMALVMALTVLVVPMYAPYNQVLLVPAILMLVRDRAMFLSPSRVRRFAYLVGVLVVGWEWAASLSLSAIYLVGTRGWAMERWKWPFLATFALPVWVFALIFFCVNKSGGQSKGGVMIRKSELTSDPA
ncbi:MAG: hypothetical protein WAK27_07380, partial [Candidatus Sulfotelmatobacter sp.]